MSDYDSAEAFPPLPAGKVFFLSNLQVFFLIQLDYSERYICHDGFGADDSRGLQQDQGRN